MFHGFRVFAGKWWRLHEWNDFEWDITQHKDNRSNQVLHSCGDVTSIDEGLSNKFDLFVCRFTSREFFIHLEGLKILTYARHSWPSSCEVFFSVPHLLWQGTSVYKLMVISEDLWHSQLVLSVWRWICHYLCLKTSSKVLQPFLVLAHHTISYLFNAVSYCNTDKIFFFKLPPFCFRKNNCKTCFCTHS